MRRWLTCLALVSALVAGPAVAQEFDLEAAKALFEQKCSACHSLDRPLKKNKDRAGWEKTVSRMARYASGMISPEDADIIVEYLTRVRGPAE
ncbi:photosystem P840 reaction-center cytochrome c-551 [Deferrisoma palaeochoriense]